MINGLSKKILGIDIGSHCVSAVLIRSSLKGLRLEDHLAIETKTPLKENEAGFYDALKAITSQLDTTGATCIVSFPFSNLFFRSLELPFKEKRKIRQILPFELEPLLPCPLDEFIIDFQPVHKEGGTGQNELVIAGVDQTELTFFLNELKAFNLDPEIVTLGSHCTARMISEDSPSDKDWIYIDLDMDLATLYFCHSGRINALRAFPVPPNISSRPSYIAGRILQTALSVGDQFGGSFLPEKVYLTGDGSDDEEFKTLLQEQINLPVLSPDLLQISGIDVVDELANHDDRRRWQRALAMGLSEIHSTSVFNFRKGPFAKKKFWLEHTKEIIQSASIAAVVLLLLGVGFLTESYTLGKQAENIDKQILETLQTVFPNAANTNGATDRVRARIQELKQKSLFADESQTLHRSIDILNEISKLTSKELDVKLDKLTISGGSVQISGDTATFNMVDDLKGKLETSEIFSSVDITSANLNKSGNRVDFKLKLQLG